MTSPAAIEGGVRRRRKHSKYSCR